ncbi:MAG: OsmC family protein [Proteobacteria bacterium]|nr:OsmC family protein [Pseudomonadota bacterium]MCH8256668.1 OsmC family protein [Pseudomonadota bacterium]
MKASVRWIEDAMFLAESGSGHTVVVDGPPSGGGRNIGMRPMELVLLGVGSCASFDVMAILKKGRQAVTDCVAHLEAERADGIPSVFTRIHIHFVVTGTGLKEAQVRRAVELSAEKYCSASIMLGRGGVDLTHSFEIQEHQN